MKKTYPLLIVIIALFMVSCASAPENRGASTEPAIENDNNAPKPPTAKNEVEKPENPFFDDDDVNSHYDDEDEDEGVVHEWFVGFLKGFWHIVTYPGRAIAHRHD